MRSIIDVWEMALLTLEKCVLNFSLIIVKTVNEWKNLQRLPNTDVTKPCVRVRAHVRIMLRSKTYERIIRMTW